MGGRVVGVHRILKTRYTQPPILRRQRAGFDKVVVDADLVSELGDADFLGLRV